MKAVGFLLSALGMLVLLGFSILVTLLLRLYAPDSSAGLIERAHSLCLDACPTGAHAELYGAVVCGGVIKSAVIRSTFAQLGLIHLLVVSGSHFVVLDTLLKITVLKITPSRFRGAFVFTILLLFTLMTKASPPVLRAFLMFCLLALNSRFSMQWTRLQTLTIAGFAVVPFCEDRWQLCSLFLSWLAALALEKMTAPRDPSEFKTLTWKQKVVSSVFINTRVYLLLIPPLLLLTVPHPLTILANVLFAPVMGFLLFPMSLVVVLVPPLTFIADRVWTLILDGSFWIAKLMPEDYGSQKFESEFLVFYLAALTLLVTAWKRKVAPVSARSEKLGGASAFRAPTTEIVVYRSPASQDAVLGSNRTSRLVILIVFLGISFSASGLRAANESPTLIVWNVGQGSWATLSTPSACHHFDLGGEFAPWPAIRKECRSKANSVSFSHWDLDHVGFAYKAARALPNLCVRDRPLGEAPNVFRQQSLADLPDCVGLGSRAGLREGAPAAASDCGRIHELFARADEMKSSNAKSRVFLTERVLFPGDSGASEEKIWANNPRVRGAKILIAGHHGSRTATSTYLLKRLSNLKLVIASARKEKFGHPSAVTVKRIARENLPLLTTEDWGTIHLQVSPAIPSVASKNQFVPRIQRAASGLP